MKSRVHNFSDGRTLYVLYRLQSEGVLSIDSDQQFTRLKPGFLFSR